MRYEPDGSLDSTFGTDGLVFTSWGAGRYNYAHAVAILPDGRIVAAGTTGVGGNVSNPLVSSDFAVARYLGDGSLDSNFGATEDGRAQISVLRFDDGEAAVLLPDGRVLVGGFADEEPNTNVDFALAMLSPDGSLDPSFGAGGIATASLSPSSTDRGYAVAVRPGGEIVIGGTSFVTQVTDPDYAILQYLPSGVIDSEFGDDGWVLTGRPPDSEQVVAALVPQANGGLLAAGHSYDGVSGTSLGYLAAIARYSDDGALDSTLADGGWFAHSFAGSYNFFYAATELPDGRILAAGRAGPSQGDFLVARLTASGVLDPTFDGDGWTITPGPAAEGVRAIAVQPDGKIVVAGYTLAPGASDIVVARYMPDGALDATFGVGGIVVTDAGTPPPVSTEPPPLHEARLQVLPSVVNGVASVRYALEMGGPVRLVVHDLLGREVRLVFAGEQPAGRQEVALETGHLRTGVYLVSLEAEGRSRTTRFVVHR